MIENNQSSLTPEAMEALRKRLHNADVRNMTSDELRCYEGELKLYRDNRVLLRYAREEGFKEGFKIGFSEGFKEGFEEGIEEGRQRAKMRMVRKMIENGLSREEIISLTGIDPDTISPA